MPISFELKKHWTISPKPGFDYIYYLTIGDNGKLYQLGVTDGTVGISAEQGFVADTFMGFLTLLVDNSVQYDELAHIQLPVTGGRNNFLDQVTDEIFNLQPSDLQYIQDNFNARKMIRELGLFALALKMLAEGAWGDLKDERFSRTAMNQLAALTKYWAAQKARYTIEKGQAEVDELGRRLIKDGTLTREEAKALKSIYEQELAK